MKHLRLLLVFIFSIQILAASDLQLLRIKEGPGTAKGKPILLMSLDDLKVIVSKAEINNVTGVINLTDDQGNPLVKLAKVKQGKIKWLHKEVVSNWLRVKFKKEDFPIARDKLKTDPKKPGLRVRCSGFRGKNKEDIDLFLSTPISSGEYPDLQVKITYPKKTKPGNDLKGKVFLIIENKGVGKAQNVAIDLVFSGRTMVLDKKPQYSTTFNEDAIIKLASETIPVINPGQKVTLHFKNSINVPQEISLLSCYIGVICDSENTNDELDENNNSHIGMIIVDIPQINQFGWDLPGILMIYNPGAFKFQILYNGIVLSDGKDWRKCNIRTHIFQFKHASWPKNLHWEINTTDRGLWQVNGKPFCKSGGRSKRLGVKIRAQGGSKSAFPTHIAIEIPKAFLSYGCKTGQFKISFNGNQLVHVPFWRMSRLKPYLYHIKHQLWQDFFWEVNTTKMEIHTITGAKFGQTGGNRSPLDVTLVTE